MFGGKGVRGFGGGGGGEKGGLGLLSELGTQFGVWKTVGLFQLECNISTETLRVAQSSTYREGVASVLSSCRVTGGHLL